MKPANEASRLETLKSFEVLDTLPEKIYNSITALASRICGTPIALISLVDENRQWFKSRHGLSATETSRDTSFCGHAILDPDHLFQVSNSNDDARFNDNPLVTGEPRVIFYAGAPLKTSDGHAIGTLCVIDHKPRELSLEQQLSLKDLADQVIALFELRVATARLRETEIRLADTIESISDAYLSWDKNWIINDVNEKLVKLSKIPRDQQIGQNFLELYFPTAESRTSAHFDYYQETMISRSPINFENFFDRFNIWTAVNAFPKSDGGVAVFFENITDEKLQEHALNIEREKLESIFIGAPAAMAIWHGPNFIFDLVNPAYQAIYPDRRLIGRPLIEAVPEMLDQPFIGMLESVYESGQPFVGHEVLTLIRPSDQAPLEERYYDFSYVRLNDIDGQPFGILDHAIDVTERVQARKKNLRGDALLKLALAAGQIGTWELDYTTGEVKHSARANEIFGFTTEASRAVEESVSRIHPDDRASVTAAIAAASHATTDTQYNLQYRIIRPDGQLRWVEMAGQPFFEMTDAGRVASGFAGTMVDITESLAAREELVKARDTAEIANSAKSAFLANMSHEIRTPLGVIMGFSDLLRNESTDPVDRAHFVSVINRNARALTRVIDDILDLSKVEAGRMAIELAPMSPRDLVHDILVLFNERAKVIGLKISYEIDANVPERIISDAIRLRQILINLFGNAVKFTERGSVNLKVTALKIDATSFDFKISIIDTGRGMNREQRERLFQPFVQADNSTAREFGGSGLGLALSRRLAEALGGTVFIEHSELGNGSTFAVTFRAHAAEIVKPQIGLPTPITLLPLQGLKVLLVEDSIDNQFLIKRLLSRNGASVIIADNGAIGSATALELKPDVVLMDIQMPVMDGYTAMMKLKSNGFTKPVIALTAHALDEEREKTRNAGFSSHVTKPIEIQDLVRAILEVTKPELHKRESH